MSRPACLAPYKPGGRKEVLVHQVNLKTLSKENLSAARSGAGPPALVATATVIAVIVADLLDKDGCISLLLANCPLPPRPDKSVTIRPR
jgi:hypothetical protein